MHITWLWRLGKRSCLVCKATVTVWVPGLSLFWKPETVWEFGYGQGICVVTVLYNWTFTFNNLSDKLTALFIFIAAPSQSAPARQPAKLHKWMLAERSARGICIYDSGLCTVLHPITDGFTSFTHCDNVPVTLCLWVGPSLQLGIRHCRDLHN